MKKAIVTLLLLAVALLSVPIVSGNLSYAAYRISKRNAVAASTTVALYGVSGAAVAVKSAAVAGTWALGTAVFDAGYMSAGLAIGSVAGPVGILAVFVVGAA